MKKTKSPVRMATTDDLKGYTLDDMLTETYGPKTSAKRKAAEAKIEFIAKHLAATNTLKEIRERRKKSQAQVADSMDVDNSVVSKLEKNFEKAQVATILRYAKALNAKHVNIVFEFDKKASQTLQLSI